MTTANDPVLPPGAFAIPQVQLEVFEKACFRRDHETGARLLVENLRRIKYGAGFIGYSRDDEIQRILFTRFCAAIMALLYDPTFNVSQEGLDNITAEHATIDLCFRMSHFQSTDHVLSLIADNPEETDRTKLVITDPNGLMKYLFTYSLRSNFTLNFVAAFSQNPAVLFNLWCGMVAPMLTIAPTAHARRDELLGLHTIFEDVPLKVSAMPALADSFMYASYGTRRDKHAMKGTIMRLFARWFVDNKADIPTREALASRKSKTKHKARFGRKPVLLVGVDWFNCLHSMYRCYAPVIRQLRKRFYLVGMGRESDTDAVGRSEFDEWHFLPGNGTDLKAVIAAVNHVAPDVIYFPSLGMSLWWLAVASVRMAPLQVMTLGHPASSFSPCIDAVLCDEGAVGDPSLFTEKIVEYPNGAGRFMARPDTPDLAKLVADADAAEFHGEIHVAVPAMLCKLNAPFLATLQEIVRRSKRPLVFHFWINMIGLSLMQAAHEIKSYLPNSFVYERSNYDQYMAALSRCHLHLSTFPFGGTNSNIDSFMLGLPVVTLWGDEPHERFDGLMLRRAGLPDLITTTPEGYVNKALELIENDDARLAMRRHLLAFDIKGEFFAPAPPHLQDAISDTLWGCYEARA